MTVPPQGFERTRRCVTCHSVRAFTSCRWSLAVGWSVVGCNPHSQRRLYVDLHLQRWASALACCLDVRRGRLCGAGQQAEGKVY